MQSTTGSTPEPAPAAGEERSGGRFPTPGRRDVAEQFDVGGWKFNPGVAEVFDDHVRASVPFYDAVQGLIAECADWLVPDGGLVADLGCSTGTTCKTIGERHKGRSLRFVLYDQQQAMLDKAKAAVAASAGVRVQTHPGRLEERDLLHQDADLTVLAFVLQFMNRPARLKVLQAARNAAAPTGALLVAEKIRPLDVRWAEIGNDVSHDYKAAAGVSDTAIRAKARALRGVLVPYPAETTMRLITDAGWHCPEVLFRWHQWAVIGAFAAP